MDEVVSGVGDEEVTCDVNGEAIRIAQIPNHGGDDARGDVDLQIECRKCGRDGIKI